jgi:hypothetical protein
MSTFALLDALGNIVNRIELDAKSDWPVPRGFTLAPDQGYAIGGTLISGVYTAPVPPPPAITFPAPPAAVVVQDLMAQLTAADMTLIQAAIADSGRALLWYTLLAQRDPLRVSGPKFQNIWSALINILGQTRANAIAAALNITP